MKMKEVKDEVVLNKILEYLESDYENCLYLYIDLSFYRLNNPNVRVWYEGDDKEIYMVVMKYHESFQVYTRKYFDKIDGLVELAEHEKPQCMSMREEIAKCLEPKVSGYKTEYGVVIRNPEISDMKIQELFENHDLEIMQASVEDAEEIAKLICSDEVLGEPYTVESLTKEIYERIETRMGRSFIIRKNGEIIAHTATFAEWGPCAVGGGLIVSPAYRDTDYFYYLDTMVRSILKKEGKILYGMVLNKRLLKAFEMTGCTVVSHYGKFVLGD